MPARNLNTVRETTLRPTFGGGGSCPRVGSEVVGAAIAQGATNLEARFLGYCASYGGSNWSTDTTRAAEILRPDGRNYHRESIARARRSLARAGFIRSVRVLPLQKPIGARWTSSHGCAQVFVRWSTLGVTPPPKRVRREAEKRQDTLSPRHISSVVVRPITPSTPKPRNSDPVMDAAIEQLRAALEPQWLRRDRDDADRALKRCGLSPPPTPKE
jgi:hypothetical protein